MTKQWSKDIVVGMQISATHCALSFVETAKGKVFKLIEQSIISAPDGGRSDIFNYHLADKIGEHLKAFEDKYRVKIQNINFAVPLNKIKKIEGSSQMVLHPRGARQVRTLHIKKAIEQARLLHVDWHYNPIHSLPIEFELDAKRFDTAPLGVYGRKLETKIMFYVLDNNYKENLERFFEYIGRKYSKLIASSLCDAASFFSDDLKRGNFVAMNIGASKTELSSFNHFALQDIVTFDYESGSVDEAIADALNIPLNLAEEVKIAYGSLDKANFADDRTVTLKIQERQKTVRCSDIYSVLDAFYSDLVAKINFYLEENKIIQQADFCVPLGQWLKLNGSADWLKSNLRCPVANVRLLGQDMGSDSRFCASIGAATFEQSRFEYNTIYSFSGKLLTRLKNIWEEYF